MEGEAAGLGIKSDSRGDGVGRDRHPNTTCRQTAYMPLKQRAIIIRFGERASQGF